MINYIETILHELGYESDSLSLNIGIIDHPFKVFIKGKGAYVVVSIDASTKQVFNDFISSYQASLFEAVLSSNKFKTELKKNSYLLVLVESLISSEYPRKQFINIEEDPFFFKKYVLRYKDDDLKSLIEKTSASNVVAALGQLAIDHNVFNKFSEESGNRTGYENLLYQIYIKVPALALPTASKDIGDLSKEILNSLAANSLKEENTKLHDLLEESDEKSIDLRLFKQIVDQL